MVAARNEELRLEETVRRLLAQRAVVVDVISYLASAVIQGLLGLASITIFVLAIVG